MRAGRTMTRHGVSLFLVFAVCTCVGLGLPRSASAKAFEIRDEGWEGCSGLYQLAVGEGGRDRIVPTERLDWSDLTPQDSLLLLHPDHAPNDKYLLLFLQAGGRFALLDDHGASDRLLEMFHIERVSIPRRPASALRQNPELAVAEPTLPKHPIVADVDKLMTNHPVGLRDENPNKMLALLKIRGADGSEVPLALWGNNIRERGSAGAESARPGTLFVMGDASTVINQMLRYPGNRALAIGLVRELLARDEPGSGAKGRLFILVDDFRETGSFAGASSGLADTLQSRMEALRDLVARFGDNGLKGPLGQGLAAALAFALGTWLFTVATRTYRRSSPGFARATPLVAQGGAAGRAAVLSASSTPAALAMLELKSALEEGLGHEIGVPGRLSSARLLEEVRAKGALDDRGQWALKGILLEMANVETLVVAGQAERVSKRDVSRASRTVFGLLSMAKERLGTRTAA
jgi:Domain of unknown function (DUF4350)